MSDLVDFSLYPLVQISVPEELDAKVAARMYEELEGLIERGGHYATVVDSTKVRRMPDALTRRALVSGSDRLERHVEKWSLGTAIVIASPVVRGAHTALRWIRGDRLSVPEVAVSTLDEAYAWAAEQLESKGVMTDAIRAHIDRRPAAGG